MKPLRLLCALAFVCPLFLTAPAARAETLPPGTKSCGVPNGAPTHKSKQPCPYNTDESDGDSSASSGDTGPSDAAPMDGDTGSIDTSGTTIGLNTGGSNLQTNDLSVPHATGDLPLALTRYYRSRDLYPNADQMGQGRSWTHSYSWSMWASGTNGTGISVLFPEGYSLDFTPVSGTYDYEGNPCTKLWPVGGAASGFAERIFKVGNFYHIVMPGGVRHTFERVTDTDSSVRYVPRYSQDMKGNTHTYTTDSRSRITRVDDAAGNWIALTYSGVEINHRRNVVLYTITANPVVGWNDVSVSASEPFRWVQAVSAPRQHFKMSEIEFYKPDSAGGTVKLSGMAYGTDPATGNGTSTFDKVFDGNTGTEFDYARPNQGIAGLDLGSGTTASVSRIRFYIPSKYAGMLAGYKGHQFVGCVESPEILTVLTQVTTSTGRTADYNYGAFLDESIGQDHLVLESVRYDGGADASFTWISAQQGSSPSILRMTEPRNTTSTPDLAFSYYPSYLAVKGQPYQVMDGQSGSVIMTSDPKKTLTITAADGGVHTVVNTNTSIYLPSSSTDAVGKKTSYTWGANAFLTSRTTFAGTTTSNYNNMGNPVTITHPDGLTENYSYDVQGRMLTRSLGATGQASRTTIYSRDAQGRATRITHPDGSYAEFTYNSIGRVTLVHERNGSYTKHVYDATGLRTSTTRGLATATATSGGETNSFTWHSPGNTSGSPARMLASVTDPRGRTTAYEYDAVGRLTKTTYADGSSRSLVLDDFGNKLADFDGSTLQHWTYDNYKRALSHTDAGGGVTTYDYGLNGCSCNCYGAGAPTLVTSPAGRKTRRIYDLKGRLIQEIKGYLTTAAAATSHTRDNLGRITATTDPDGYITTMSYDSMDRVLTVAVDPTGLNLVTNNSYNALGDLLSITLPGGRIIGYNYDLMGRVISMTDPLGITSTQSYNSGGRRIASTVAAGTGLARTTHFRYDRFDRLTGVTYPDGSTTSQTYHHGGETATRTDELGHIITADSALLTWTDTFGSTWTTFANTVTDALGRVSVSYSTPIAFVGGTRRNVSPAGRIQESYLDEQGHNVLSRSGYVTATSGLTPNPSDTVMTYDADGLALTASIDPTGLNQITHWTYNSLGHAITTTDPLNRTTTSSYDKRGNLTATKLPDNRRYVYTYDALGRRLVATDPKNQRTTSTYWNDTGNVLTLKDAKNQTTVWTYDSRGMVLAKAYPNGDTHHYTYNALGRMATHVTPKNETCTYSYDARDRQTHAGWSSTTSATTREYWANGLLKSIDNGVSRSDYAYDNANQLITDTQKLASRPARTVSYGHDADGLRSELSRSVGVPPTSYIRTARGQLQSVSADGPPPLATYSYDKAGRNTAVIHENGITESKAYDAAGELVSNTHLKGDTAVSGHGYTLDTTGRRTAETFADGSTPARTYGYDNADQVTSASYGSSLPDAYNYDLAGNRTSAIFSRSVGVPPTNGTITYTANNANQYTTISGWSAPSYDANGNLLQEHGVSRVWDSKNRLLSVTPNIPTLGDKALVHTYDSHQRRVTTSVRQWTSTGWNSLETTQFIYDGWNVIAHYSLGTSSAALVRNFTWGCDVSGSLQGAGGVGGLRLAEEISGSTTTAYHFHYDGNGNVTEVTDLSGNNAASYRYDAFGNTLSATGNYATQNRYRFSTKALDSEVTSAPLYYYGYRYYDPMTGMWPSKDLIGERGGVNLYGFVGNDGINWVDLFGLKSKDYDTQDEAGRAGAEMATEKTEAARVTGHAYSPEWAGLVCVNCKTKKFYYSDPNRGLNEGDLKPGQGGVSYPFKSPCDKPDTPVATYHSHPNSNPNSGPDRETADKIKLPSYVGVHVGDDKVVDKYEPDQNYNSKKAGMKLQS